MKEKKGVIGKVAISLFFAISIIAIFTTLLVLKTYAEQVRDTATKVVPISNVVGMILFIGFATMLAILMIIKKG